MSRHTLQSIIQIDRSKPLHMEIRRALEQGIEHGLWKPGERLPSEAELQQLTGASRTPIRQALTQLEMAGVIYRAQGRGSYVRSSKISSAIHQMVSFGQELRRQGHRVVAKTLELAEVPADWNTAGKLQLAEGTQVIYLRRLFLVDDAPMALFDHHVSPLIGIDALSRLGDFPSLHDLLAEKGYRLHGATEAISARLLTASEARILQSRTPCVALTIDRVAWPPDNHPILITRFLIRADRMEYRLQVSSQTETNG